MMPGEAKRVAIVGAGPAGVRAAERLVKAGLAPIVIDEGFSAGGQIYRRPPGGEVKDYSASYGADASRARAIHQAFARIGERIDYRPQTLAWNIRENRLWIARDGNAEAIAFDALLLATGALDRSIPVPGWDLPGCYTMGGSQIALKAHGCAIGERVAFVGTGPLLYLVAWQYSKAGATVVSVLDTAPRGSQLRAIPGLLARPDFLMRGARFRADLARQRIPVHTGATPLRIEGADDVERLVWEDASGREHVETIDAVALGFHLRSETQLADLAGVAFSFDDTLSQWVPQRDASGRTGVRGIYMAGDGARVLGADAAEAGGRLAACAILADLGRAVDVQEVERLQASMTKFERFRDALATAFPWPAALAAGVADDAQICRCENITAGQLREVASLKGAPELNRAKALSRVGMGRCQGRYCGPAAAEILAACQGKSLDAVGRMRGQAPVKPLSGALKMKDADA